MRKLTGQETGNLIGAGMFGVFCYMMGKDGYVYTLPENVQNAIGQFQGFYLIFLVMYNVQSRFSIIIFLLLAAAVNVEMVQDLLNENDEFTHEDIIAPLLTFLLGIFAYNKWKTTKPL